MKARVNDSDFQKLGTAARNSLYTVQFLLRGGLTLHDNMSTGHVYTATFGAGYVANAAQDFDITSLNIVWTPGFYLVAAVDNGQVVYNTSGDVASWSSTNLRIRSNLAGAQTVKVWVF